MQVQHCLCLYKLCMCAYSHVIVSLKNLNIQYMFPCFKDTIYVPVFQGYKLHNIIVMHKQGQFHLFCHLC